MKRYFIIIKKKNQLQCEEKNNPIKKIFYYKDYLFNHGK
jgi:hypothetical protein